MEAGEDRGEGIGSRGTKEEERHRVFSSTFDSSLQGAVEASRSAGESGELAERRVGEELRASLLAAQQVAPLDPPLDLPPPPRALLSTPPNHHTHTCPFRATSIHTIPFLPPPSPSPLHWIIRARPTHARVPPERRRRRSWRGMLSLRCRRS